MIKNKKQADAATWHYIDCSDGSVVKHTNGITAVDRGYLLIHAQVIVFT